MDFAVIVGSNIRNARKRKGFTLDRMSELMAEYGCTIATVSQLSAWERGTRSISAENLWIISCVLGVTMDSLVRDHDSMQRAELELARMNQTEQAVISYGMHEWTGDYHSLVRACGMYMQMPATYRCDIIILLASMWDMARRQGVLNSVPYNVPYEDIRDQCEKMHR